MSILGKRNDQSAPARSRIGQAVRMAGRGCLLLVLVVALACLGLYGAILVRPQGVSRAAQMALTEIQPRIAPWRLAFERVEVRTAHVGAPVLLEGHGLRLSRDESVWLEAPLLRVELGLSMTPLPHPRLNDVLLQSPLLHAEALAAGNEDAAAPTNAEAHAAWNDLKRRAARWQRIVAVRQLRVADGHVRVSAQPDAPTGSWDLALRVGQSRLSGSMNAEWPTDGEPARLQLSLTGDPRTDDARITGHAEHLRARRMPGLPWPAWLAGADYPVTLEIEGAWVHQALQSMDVVVDGGEGLYDWPAMFSEPLAVKHLHAKAHAGPAANRITLSDITLEVPETVIHSQVDIEEGPEGYALSIQSRFPELPTDRLSAYWPLKLAPITRIWAVGNIHHGMIREAQMRMRLRPQDLDAPDLPKEALRASMRIEDVEVRYLPTHPPARAIAGTVTFSGQDMRLELTGADYLSATHFDGGWLAIPSFDAPETALDAEFKLRTTAADVAALFATKEIDLAKSLHLTPEAKGKAEGTVGIHAIIFSSQPNPAPEYYADQFKYKVDARLEGVGQPKFLGDTDIADARMDLVADNAHLSTSGTLQLNGVPARLSTEADFDKDGTVTKVAMNLPAAKLPAFGYPVQPGVSGSIGVEAVLTGAKDAKGKRANSTALALDLTATGLDLPMAGLSKPAGEKAALAMTTRLLPNGGTGIDPLSYHGRDAVLEGALALDAKGGLQRFAITHVRFGRQDASLRYGPGADGVPELFVRGASLDLNALRDYRDKHPASPKSANPLDPGPIRADVQLDKFWYTEIPLEQLHVKLVCNRALCASAEIRGQVGADARANAAASPFSLRILQEDGARRFRLESANGGRLCAALDVTDHLSGGALTVKATYDDARPRHPLIGKAHMGEFYVRRAPLLTKVLSLTSPTGIVNALLGKGIGFDGMSTGFTFENGTLDIRDARASGSALGLTAEEGSIQLGTQRMQLKGTVIPAYMLNSVIGKIPLIGEWLVGGKGQGLIATRFSLKGTPEDPEVSVNPLSILTPGFLRGVFDVFDAKESQGDEGERKGEAPNEDGTNP